MHHSRRASPPRGSGCATPAFAATRRTSTRGCSRSTCSAGTTARLLTDRARRAAARASPHATTRSSRGASRREPIAYIIGRQEFWGLHVRGVAGGPDSAAGNRADRRSRARAVARSRTAPLTIADVCTGSGCLAVALARERPRARVVATDISDAALDVARRNAARHGVADRIDVRARRSARRRSTDRST